MGDIPLQISVRTARSFFIREQGVDIQDRLLAQVSPIPLSHIGITGDYLWNEIDHPLERFRPLRANHFNPKGFVFP